MSTPIKTWRQHDCTRRHRTPRSFMKCAMPRAAWIDGEGPFASIAYCGQPTVMLFPTLTQAEEVSRRMGRCGHLCTGHHDVIKVEP